MSLFRLDGQVVIVTGGAGLFGKSISLALAEAGANLIIASRDKEKCETYAASLRSRGLQAAGVALDLSSEESIISFVNDVLKQHGAIDVLVNNAVSRDGIKDLEALTKQDIEESQVINTTGLLLLTKWVVKSMREKGAGNIINVGSIQGAVGPNFPVYGQTGMSSPVNYTYDKWGMVGFTKWLANYYGKYNIRANCISPGGYGPALEGNEQKQEFIENYKRLTPLGRFANDEDMKGPIVFLASAASAYITGHNLMVDGGWTNW